VRELRRHIDTPLETGRHRSLPLQRLWPLLQDERPESTPHQAEATPGKYLSCLAAATSGSYESKLASSRAATALSRD